MRAELTQHLGCEKNDPAGYNSGNSRATASRSILDRKSISHRP